MKCKVKERVLIFSWLYFDQSNEVLSQADFPSQQTPIEDLEIIEPFAFDTPVGILLDSTQTVFYFSLLDRC